jgi:hypothetical protein
MEGPKARIPIGPFVLGQAVRSQDIENRAFLECTSPTTLCKSKRCVTAGGDNQAALCAADRAGEASQQGASGGVRDPPLKARRLTHSPNLKGSLTPPLECPTVPYEMGSVFPRRLDAPGVRVSTPESRRRNDESRTALVFGLPAGSYR